MKKIIFILALLCIACNIYPLQVFSQGPPTATNGYMRTDLISPSPTAANLGRFGNVPVTYYTGTPNISIPIFTVEGTDLKLPITLAYNYNGFKPAEEASWVGLGWSLQAGGVITRTLGDKVDEDYVGANKYNRTVDMQNVGSQQYLTNAYKNAMYDLMPDVFSFNFAGYSGKFILYDGVFSVTPAQKFKISGNTTAGFTIITDDGTKYQFTASETSMKKSTGYEPYIIPAYESAWYLTKITNAANTESITLEYSTEGPIYQYGTMVQSFQDHITGYVTSPNGYMYSQEIMSSPSAAFSSKVQDAKRLIAIHSEKHKVHFISEEFGRQDIDGAAFALDYILIYSADNKIIKQFDLQTEYYGGGGNNKFLKLKRLRQSDTTMLKYIQHEFEYENESSLTGAIDSYVDHYGYLKGGGGMPGSYFPPPVGTTNREPVFNFAKSGALKRIKYPTGGWTDLEYDQNTYYDGIKYNYVYQNTFAYGDPTGLPSQITQQMDTFSCNFPQTINLLVTRSPKITPPQAPPDTPIGSSNQYEVRLELVHYVNGVPDYYEIKGTYQLYMNSENAGKNFVIQITDPGVYQIVTRCDAQENQVTASVGGVKRFQRDPIEGKGGAGIRIKKITENPVIGTPIVRNYYYANDMGFSTGTGLSAPMYNAQGLTKEVLNNQLIPIGTVQMVDHTSMVAESPEQGLPFYYSRVIEEVVSDASISRTKYYFNHFSGHNDADLVKQEDFKHEGGNFVKVRQTRNVYDGHTLEVFTGISIVKTHELYQEGLSPDPFVTYDWLPNAQYIFWKYLKSSKETLYAGSDSLVTETINYYDNVTRNLAGVKKKNSDGSTYFTKYKYPEDYANPIGGTLRNANLITPLEEQVWRKSPAGDSVMISGKISQYNHTNKKIEKIYVLESASGITSLDSENWLTLVSDSRYKSKIDFTYNSSARLISQQLTNDAPVSYLWAYPVNTLANSPVPGLNYPIAEIKNAQPAEVFYTSFEESGTTVHAKTGRRSFNGVYTIAGSYTGDYKLSYWKKTGSGPWQLIESTLANPANIQIGAVGSWVDEVRLCPVKAIIKTFTYLNGWGLSQVNDANNVITHFRYDPYGRLLSIRDDNANILSNYQYNYKNSGSN